MAWNKNILKSTWLFIDEQKILSLSKTKQKPQTKPKPKTKPKPRCSRSKSCSTRRSLNEIYAGYQHPTTSTQLLQQTQTQTPNDNPRTCIFSGHKDSSSSISRAVISGCHRCMLGNYYTDAFLLSYCLSQRPYI